MSADCESRQRKIIHVDMDAFFASVEQRDNPALRGLPVAVGSRNARGVVAAASYEARAFGVRSAMPSVTALRRCPSLVFVKPRFEVYHAVSQQIRAIFADYTDLVEPLSLDEAYLDVTGDQRRLGSARAIAEAIRARIRAETGLTASAGVSYNKFIAKMASDENKPDGICIVPPHRGPEFVARLPVRRFYGVGPVTAAKMERLGIRTGADLRAYGLEKLQTHFGSSASYLANASQGLDERQVRSHRNAKSVGAERTFANDLSDPGDLDAALGRVVDAAWTRIERSGVRGRTVTLKVRFGDFQTISRACSLPAAIASERSLKEVSAELLSRQFPLRMGIRLLGVTLSGIGDRAIKACDATPPLLAILQG